MVTIEKLNIPLNFAQYCEKHGDDLLLDNYQSGNHHFITNAGQSLD